MTARQRVERPRVNRHPSIECHPALRSASSDRKPALPDRCAPCATGHNSPAPTQLRHTVPHQRPEVLAALASGARSSPCCKADRGTAHRIPDRSGPSEDANFTASACTISSRVSAPSKRALALSEAATGADCSTMTTLAAPREAASKPSAPLPAKRSRQDRPDRSCPSQLNNVSRTRSGVGRRPSASGKRKTRRRHSPPMMRTEFIAGLLAADHDGHQVFRRDVPGKCRADVGRRHFADILDVAIQVIERQPVESDHGDVVENLAITVETQREAAGDVLFCGLQFRLARSLGEERRQNVRAPPAGLARPAPFSFAARSGKDPPAPWA